MKRFYIDCETTGLDAEKHEIIEICIVVEDTDGEIIDEFHTRIKPQNIEGAESKALEVNGYSAEKWFAAVEPSSSVADKIIELLHHPQSSYYQRGLWIGHNPYFDRRFIDAFLNRYGSSVKKIASMPMLDTKQLSMGLYWPQLLSYSLDSIRVHLKIESSQHHSALDDCYMCRRIVNNFIVAKS